MYGYRFRTAADILSAAKSARRPMGPGPFSVIHSLPAWRRPAVMRPVHQYGTWDLGEAVRIAVRLARKGGHATVISDNAARGEESRVLSVWPSRRSEGTLQAQLTD